MESTKSAIGRGLRRLSAGSDSLVTVQERDYASGMFYIPVVDEDGKRILRVLQSAGVAPGWQLMSEASVTPDVLAQSTAKLIDMGLISANSTSSNPKDIGQVYFNIQPSNRQIAEIVLNSN
jgi:hypothetical protein